MIKDLLYRSFSVTLALLVLFSTVSFTIEKHYCAGNLIDVALFTKAKTCGMEVVNTSNNSAVSKKSCCKDEVDVIQGQNELKFSSFEDLNFDQQVFLTAFSHSYINLFESLPQQIISHKDYSPPNLVVDIQLLNAIFLI